MIDDLTFEVWLNKSQMLLQTDNGHKSLPIFKRNTVFLTTCSSLVITDWWNPEKKTSVCKPGKDKRESKEV